MIKMTEKKLYTEEGVPIISLGRLNSFGRDLQIIAKQIMENGGKSDTLDGWIAKMDETNKGASSYVVAVSKFFPPELKPLVYAVLTGFYELIRSQGDANKLEEETK